MTDVLAAAALIEGAALVFVWGLCRAAARGDRRLDSLARPGEPDDRHHHRGRPDRAA